MKTMRALTLPLLFALTACGASEFPSVGSNGSDNTPINLDQPNRLLLRSIANMMSDDVLANRVNFSLVGETETFIGYTDYQVESSFNVDVSGDAVLNAPGFGQGQSQVNLSFNRFGINYASSNPDGSFYSEESYQYADETAAIYVEEGVAHVDLSPGATEIAYFLFPSTNSFFPERFRTEAPSELTSGLLPRIEEADVNAWIEAMLPMVDGLSLLSQSVSGSELTVRYEITQDDLRAIYERIYLGDLQRSDLDQEQLAYLDNLIEEVTSAITLNSFVVAFTINLLSNQLIAVFADIDVEYAYFFEFSFPYYDPENPEADDDGFAYMDYELVYEYGFALEFSASLETFNEPFTLVGPVNKEEYEWLTLRFEDPNLF